MLVELARNAATEITFFGEGLLNKQIQPPATSASRRKTATEYSLKGSIVPKDEIPEGYRLISMHGSYNFRQTKFKDFSRTFQGQKLVFKDQGLFNQSTLFVSFFPPRTLIHNPFQFLNSLCNIIL